MAILVEEDSDKEEIEVAAEVAIAVAVFGVAAAERSEVVLGFVCGVLLEVTGCSMCSKVTEGGGEQSGQGKDDDTGGEEIERGGGGGEVGGIRSIIIMDTSADDCFKESFLWVTTGGGGGSVVAGWSVSSEPAADIRKSRLLKRPDKFSAHTTTSAALGLLPLQMQHRC